MFYVSALPCLVGMVAGNINTMRLQPSSGETASHLACNLFGVLNDGWRVSAAHQLINHNHRALIRK